MKLSINSTWDGEPVDSSESVDLSLRVTEESLYISVEAPFHGDPAPESEPGPTDGLWNFEVVELFIVGSSGAYTEIELSPHGHHLVLQLSGPRVVERSLLPLNYRARVEGDRWTGMAELSRSILPEAPDRVNAFAIHGVGDARRYLAWQKLPGNRPDFHQPDRFAELCIEGLNKGC